MTLTLEARLRTAIRDVPDFPRPGILFKDITPVLGDGALFAETTRAMAAGFGNQGVTHVVAVESRGFILGAPVAHHLGAGLVLARKRGKLPRATLRAEYSLEYGTDALEVHADALPAGAKAVIVDDVLATGGTAAAAAALVQAAGAELRGFSFLMVLEFLAGRSRLGNLRVDALLAY